MAGEGEVRGGAGWEQSKIEQSEAQEARQPSERLSRKKCSV